MTHLLSFEDVFVIGIGFDIAGAYLLAKGLLLSSHQILYLSSTFLDFSSAQLLARIEDRISSRLGVIALMGGFGFQLAGYALNLAVSANSATSWWRAGVAILLSVASALGVIALHRVIKAPWRRRLLIDVSRYNIKGIKQEYPYAFYLEILGKHMSLPVLDGETSSAYVKRVWRVREITEGNPQV